MTKIFQVEGMRCQKCVDKIEKFVGEIEGIQRIQVDLSAHSVEVDYELPADEGQIKEAILDSGFDVK